MTRAKKRLFISEAGGITYEEIPRYPSRFILDIDQEMIEYTEKPDEALINAARRYCENQSRHLKVAAKLDLLEKGQRVEHAIFGVGTVIDINTDEEGYLIQFDNMETPRQIAMKVRLKEID